MDYILFFSELSKNKRIISRISTKYTNLFLGFKQFFISILMNLARDLSDYFQFFGRKLHIVIFLALSKAFSAGLKAFP